MPLAQWEWDVHIMMEEFATTEERVELLEKAKMYGSNLSDMEYWKELVRARNARAEEADAYSVEPNAYEPPAADAPSAQPPPGN